MRRASDASSKILLAGVHAAAGRTQPVEDGNPARCLEEVRNEMPPRSSSPGELPPASAARRTARSACARGSAAGSTGAIAASRVKASCDLVGRRSRPPARRDRAPEGLLCSAEKTRFALDQGAIRNDVQLVGGAEDRAAAAPSNPSNPSPQPRD